MVATDKQRGQKKQKKQKKQQQELQDGTVWGSDFAHWPAELLSMLSSATYIGGGYSGDVYRCSLVDGGPDIAVKVSDVFYKEGWVILDREIDALKRFGGGDVIGFHGALQTNPTPITRQSFIVMEAADGDLYEQVLGRSFDKTLWPTRLKLFIEILRGVKKLAKAGYVHMDVKPENILIKGDTSSGDNCHAKLADLEGACHVGAVRCPQGRSLRGSRFYLAPEVWAGRLPTLKQDVWSAGILLYELALGDVPEVFYEDRFAFVADEGDEDISMDDPIGEFLVDEFDIRDDNLFQVLMQEDPKVAELIAKMLERDPNKRIDVKQSLESALKIAEGIGLTVPTQMPPKKTSPGLLKKRLGRK